MRSVIDNIAAVRSTSSSAATAILSAAWLIKVESTWRLGGRRSDQLALRAPADSLRENGRALEAMPYTLLQEIESMARDHLNSSKKEKPRQFRGFFSF